MVTWGSESLKTLGNVDTPAVSRLQSNEQCRVPSCTSDAIFIIFRAVSVCDWWGHY